MPIKVFIISVLAQTPLLSEWEQALQKKSRQEIRLICVKSQDRPLGEYSMLGAGGETRRYSDSGIPSVSPSNDTSTPQHGYSGTKDVVNFKIQENASKMVHGVQAPVTKTDDKLSWIPRSYLYGGRRNQAPQVVL